MIDNLSKLKKKHTTNTIKEMELQSGQRGGGTTGDSNGLCVIAWTRLWSNYSLQSEAK